MKTFSTVLFDLGRVLINIDFDAFPRSLGLDPEHARPDERTAVGQLAIRYETGRLTTDEFFEALGELLRGRYTRKQLVAAWNAIIRDENSAILPIVDAVQARCRTAVLSNTNPIHFQKSSDGTTILKKFSKRYLSFQIGAVKPDPEIYRYVVRDLSVEPSTIVLIDDVAENVKAAGQCGMVGILFENVSKLEKDLRLRRILV